jgi:hypothetical protein
MNPEYQLEDLIKIFSDHANKYEKQRLEYREKNGEPHYDDSFNICKALLCFAKEIKELKNGNE